MKFREHYIKNKLMLESFYDGYNIGGKYIEMYKNPTLSELNQLYKDSYDNGVRIGMDLAGNFYVWIEDILHDLASKALKIPFQLRFEYTKNRDTLFASSHVDEDTYKKSMDKVKLYRLQQMFPNVKKIEQSTSPFNTLHIYK